jgi:hypothetical protein
MDAQNAQIRTASLVIGIEPKSTQSGTARVLLTSRVTQRDAEMVAWTF